MTRKPLEETPETQKPVISATDKKNQDFEVFGESLANFIKMLVRASQGLNPRDSRIQNFIDVEMLPERTIITLDRAYAHTYMRTVSEVTANVLHERYPGLTSAQIERINPYAIFEDLSELEDRYFNSVDGKNRDYAVLLEKARNQVTFNEVSEGVGPQQQKKRGIMDRVFRREDPNQKVSKEVVQ